MAVEPATKVIELKTVFDAPVAHVWDALSTADGLCRWFCTKAEVEPGEGGRVAIGWSVGDDFEVPITIWQPNKQLRLDNPPFQMDFTLKPRGERTELKLVNPTSAPFYDATRSGWLLFFANLRHYLAGHFGEECETLEIPVPLLDTVEDGWRRLKEAINLESGQFRIPDLGLTGVVDVFDPPYVVGGKVDDVLFRVSFNYTGEPDRAHLVVLGYGGTAARVRPLATIMEPWLDRVLGG